MPNQKNIEAVDKLTEKLSKAKAVYFTDYLGLNVDDITVLRGEFFKENVDYTVAKNTLIKLAAKKNEIDGLDDFLSGPTAIAISFEDPTGPARVLKKFTKDHDLPEVKGIIFDGEVFAGTEFKRIASLPTKDQLLATLVGMLKSPMTKLAQTVKAPMSNLGYALSSLKEQKS